MNLPPRVLRYGDVRVDFRAERGVVSTSAPWVTLENVQMFSTASLPLDARLRLYGARPGETVKLRDLLEILVHD
jgi:hypothetical protein